MATRKPVSIKDAGAFLSPKTLTSFRAMDCAPPECSRMAPNIAPSPTTVATKPSVPPIPLLIEPIIASGVIPAIRPTTILEINK